MNIQVSTSIVNGELISNDVPRGESCIQVPFVIMEGPASILHVSIPDEECGIDIAGVVLEIHEGKLMCYVYDSHDGDPVVRVALLEDARNRRYK